MRLGALFAVLVGINVYVFFFRGGTSIQDILKTSAITKQSQTTSKAKPSAKKTDSKASKKAAGLKDDSLILRGSLKGHMGLSSALAAQKLSNSQINELIEVLRTKLNMRSLRPEHTFEIRLDPRTSKVRKFTYRTSTVSAVVVSRGAGGSFRVRQEERKLRTKLKRQGGRIHTSLNSAVSKAGEGPALVAQFVNLFSWDINWYADPRQGDTFRVLVEKRYLSGKFYKYGRILAAEYKGHNGRYQVFYHKSKNGHGAYYSADGRAIRRAFLKTPLNFRRISSKFNKKRFHPVLHRTKGHYGVDYAAARGTPVWAAADGEVLKAARSGGAGNMIMLSHAGGIKTVYMHLNGFAKGIKRGAKVRQKQVIGFVGSTGMATGAHLHYGMMRGGKHLDPLKFNVGKGPLLPRQERNRFLDDLPERRAALESIPVHNTSR